MYSLSKAKLLAYRQCPKRLWLEIHRSMLREALPQSQARMEEARKLKELSRPLYDPAGRGQVIDPREQGCAAALAQSTAALALRHPVFGAGFTAGGAIAFADVLLPARDVGTRAWRMFDVSSSASVKPHHRDTAALQAYVAKEAGVPLAAIGLAHIDSQWVYMRRNDYRGLLREVDLSADAFAQAAKVKVWIRDALAIASMRTEPTVRCGRHCNEPHACGFAAYCRARGPQAEYPVRWLPGVRTKALKGLIELGGVTDLRDVPDAYLNARQRRVKACTLSGNAYFDRNNAATDLAAHTLPAYFIDFETVQFVVPIWQGTRPYQAIPFQFSVHSLSRSGKLGHQSFIDLTGADPSRAFAESLIGACGERGPVFVYNAAFEAARVRELGARFPEMERPLLAINDRMVDLLRVAEQRYYHPGQQGSWSIKRVLPAIAPELRYDALDGVQDGEMAMTAYREAIAPGTASGRKKQIERQLLDYCGLDTYALVRIWKFLSGQSETIAVRAPDLHQ